MSPQQTLATTCFCTHAPLPARGGAQAAHVAHKTSAPALATRRRPQPARVSAPRATLLPQECRWGSEADRVAIEAEFRVGRRGTRASPAVDADMGRLRERMAASGERARREVCGSRHVAALAARAGVPLVDVVSREPTVAGWALLSMSAVVPLAVLCTMLQVVQSASVAGAAPF